MDNVLACLRELADLDSESAGWHGLIPGKMYVFSESVEGLFGDSGLDDALSGGVVFSPDIDDQFRELARLLGQIAPLRPIDDIIADPLLPAVRVLAVELLARLT